MDDSQIHRLMTQSGCGGTLTPAVRRFAQACAATGAVAERERWELHLSATRKLAEANSKRGDDCGMLARTFLDALKAMKA